MYTPRRRSSVSESTYRFTPSKRGQAALDALALGYDVQLPDYSLALLPRSATSEQALASMISTSASTTVEQLPRSTSYGEPSHRVTPGSNQGSGQRYPSSEQSDRRRFARQGRSPRGENVLYSSSNIDSPFTSLATRVESPSSVVDSRPSTSSLQSSTPQYVLTSPVRDAPVMGPVQLEQASAALASLQTPRSLPRSPAQSGYAGHHTTSRNKPTPPKLPIEAPNQSVGVNSTLSCHLNERNTGDSRAPSLPSQSVYSSPHTSPIKPAAPPLGASHRSLNHNSRALPPLRIDIGQLGRQTKEGPYSAHDPQYLRTLSRPAPLYSAQPSPERDNQDSYRALQQISRGPIHYRHSISSAHPSSSYQTSRLPTIDEPRHLKAQQAQFQPSNLDKSNSRQYIDRSHRLQFGAALRPSSPSQASTSPSPDKPPSKLPHHGLTQSLNRFVPPSRRSLSPHTPSSSLPSSHNADPDDEAFRVHPERAAISRMESMLMLSACRYEAEGRWPIANGSRSTTDLELTGFPTGQAGLAGGINGFTMPLAQMSVPYLAYGVPGLELGEWSAQTPSDVSYQSRLQTGPSSPVHPRTPGGTRGRQRSGSMHVLSPQRHGPPRNASPPRQRQPYAQSPRNLRNRQRSMSLTVQGLSPEAVKKLRVYETLKGREGGRPESLREMVGVGLPPDKKQTARTRKNGGSSRGSKSALSPTETFTPVDPSPVGFHTSTISSPALPTEIPLPPSPKTVPLPPSPVLVPPLSPAQIALPPSRVCSPAQGLPTGSSATKAPAPTISPLVSSESFMKYRVSHGIESPRPMRTRQNTASGRVVPTFRLISSPEKADRLVLGPRLDLPSGADEGLGAPDNLKPDPAIERILTPPPSFWSPPPLSAIVRTSAPLLPAAGPLRAMSVPPPGAGEAQIDEVRRAWSCEPPVNVEVRVGRSFAGDWSQCMVIDVSDEEDEEDMVTDASPSEDESELEDESQEEMGRREWERRTSRHKDLAGSGVGKCLRDVVETPERDEVERECGDTIDYFKGGRGASKYYIGGGGSSAGSGSGANAVEAVQSAIVRLAMDNAEISHAQRMQELQSKFLARPPLSAGLVPRYPTYPHLQPKQSLDYPQYSRTSQMQASINAYFDPPTTHVLQSKSQSQHASYLKSNPALDSLRSGLEKRVAASASAVEEAVRARSASPSLPQAARVIAGRSVSGPVLPPRLQRLQAARAWTPPKLSLAQLEIPPFSQGPSSAQTSRPLLSISPVASPVLPQRLVAISTPSVSDSLKDNIAKQPPLLLVAAAPTSPPRPTNPVPSPGLSAERKKTKSTHLPDIVIDQTPVPVAPATAPLTRSKRNKHHKRRSADGASSKNHAEPSTPAVGLSNTAPGKAATPVVESLKEPATPNPSQPSASASSPTTKPRPRGRHSNRYSKFKKGPQSEKQNVPSTPDSNSAPASAPAPAPPPPPASAPIPALAPTADTPSPPIAQENTTTTKPFRKKKYYRKSKTNKPGSTSAGS